MFCLLVLSSFLIFGIAGAATLYAIDDMGLRDEAASGEEGVKVAGAPWLKDAAAALNQTLVIPISAVSVRYATGRLTSRSPQLAFSVTVSKASSTTEEEEDSPEIASEETILHHRNPKGSKSALLLCTAGPSLRRQSVPPDGICDQLYYTSVHVLDHRVQSAEDDAGWNRFRRSMAALKKPSTTGGIAFDIRYLEEESLYHSEFRTELRTLSTKNIRHFGILNVIANADVLAGMVTRLKKITARLKVLQYHDRSRFLAVAIGLSKHNEGFAWDRYRQYLKTLSSYPLDILVAISSVGGIAGERECFAIPPTIWSSANGTSPSLERHVELVSEWASSIPDTLRLGLSLEMGVTSYVLANRSTHRRDAPFAPCLQSSLDSYEQVCHPGARVWRLDRIDTNIGSRGSWIFFFDNAHSVVAKAERAMANVRREKFCWLLFDVHLSDLSGKCIPLFHRERKLAEHLSSVVGESQHDE
ncbi:uncharacterized protein LOC144129483 [Amblyomma americanum]